MHNVFVYGTLRSGQCNQGMMREATFLGKDFIKAKRVTVTKAYPGIEPGEGEVSGELYQVDEELLKRLDRFEGCPFLYERKAVETKGGVEAWAYYPSPEYITSRP